MYVKNYNSNSESKNTNEFIANEYKKYEPYNEVQNYIISTKDITEIFPINIVVNLIITC